MTHKQGEEKTQTHSQKVISGSAATSIHKAAVCLTCPHSDAHSRLMMPEGFPCLLMPAPCFALSLCR